MSSLVFLPAALCWWAEIIIIIIIIIIIPVIIMPSPMAVRLAADRRPSADGSAVRTSLVASQLQAASVPIA